MWNTSLNFKAAVQSNVGMPAAHVDVTSIHTASFVS